MSKIDLPKVSEHWTNADLIAWINSRNEPITDLLENVDAKIGETQKQLNETHKEIEKLKNDSTHLDESARLCCELRERLKVVVDVQAKEQLASEFDTIAIFDKADRRATNLIKILMAHKEWKKNVEFIENLDAGEPASEDVIFSLQKSHEVLSEFLDVPERMDYLEKVKDVFLSWYSTRIVLALQSESPVEALLSIKQKHEKLRRMNDFNVVIKHYIKDQSKIRFQVVDTLSDLFLDTRNALVDNFSRILSGWAEKSLDEPSSFVAIALDEMLQAQRDEIEEVCTKTVGRALENDRSGAQALKMVLEFKQLLERYISRPDDHMSVEECVTHFGETLLVIVAGEYSKLTTSFLANCSTISLDYMRTSVCLEQLSNGFSQLMKESDYLIQMARDTFENLAVIFVVSAFRTMYENIKSLFSKFFKTNMEKSNVKDADILRLVSLSGQLMTWMENDRINLKNMLEEFDSDSSNLLICKVKQNLSDAITIFENKLSAKAEGDIGLAKMRSELRKMNKRFVSRAVEVLSQSMITDFENGLRKIKQEYDRKSSDNSQGIELPAFGTAPNEFVTAAGVALLSLAHQLSSYSQDANMASALAFSAKADAIDDIPSWWIGKCAIAVQECFVDEVGNVVDLPTALCRQLAVDYAYLDDVFDDLGTAQSSTFKDMRLAFVNLGFITA